MDLSKLDSELDKIIECVTLKGHMRSTFEQINFVEDPASMEEATSLMLGSLSKINAIGVYDGDSPKLFRKHNIEPELQIEAKNSLELIAFLYCVYSIYPSIMPDLSMELNKLKKISQAAKKLRDLLPTQNDDLFGILKLIDGMERLNLTATNTNEFFSLLDNNLKALETMSSQVSLTAFGQLTKIKSKSPKGHIAIRIFIAMMNDLWTRILGRNFSYDGTAGLNGVSRFIDFTFDAILPLHPSIEHSQIEYAVRAFRNQPDDAHAFLKPKT